MVYGGGVVWPRSRPEDVAVLGIAFVWLDQG